MPVITVYADSSADEAAIAQGVAAELGYALVDRGLLDQLVQAGAPPREELVRALDEPPRLLGMRARRRQELLSHIQVACLERLAADNVVTHGLGAHLYAQGVSHVLRVRILADPQERLAQTVRDQQGNPSKAARGLEDSDQDRRAWSLDAFGLDQGEAALYDMVFSLSKISPEMAIKMICDAANSPKFQAMTYSRRCLADQILAARVRRELLAEFGEIRVNAQDGTVVVQMRPSLRGQRKRQTDLRERAGQVEGVNYVEVHVVKQFTEPLVQENC